MAISDGEYRPAGQYRRAIDDLFREVGCSAAIRRHPTHLRFTSL